MSQRGGAAIQKKVVAVRINDCSNNEIEDTAPFLPNGALSMMLIYIKIFYIKPCHVVTFCS